jgi:mono/diheme cytochrome c family protein
MRKSAKKTTVILALAAILLVVIPFAMARVWTELEERAYRSPVKSETEEITPWTQWLEDQAAAAQELTQVMPEAPKQPATLSGAALVGEGLFQANGCHACHSLDGQRKIGPSLRGVFGTTVELNDGSTVPVDDEYLVESILQPEVKRVAGYDDAAMASYEGILSVEDARALAEYIKSLE